MQELSFSRPFSSFFGTEHKPFSPPLASLGEPPKPPRVESPGGGAAAPGERRRGGGQPRGLRAGPLFGRKRSKRCVGVSQRVLWPRVPAHSLGGEGSGRPNLRALFPAPRAFREGCRGSHTGCEMPECLTNLHWGIETSPGVAEGGDLHALLWVGCDVEQDDCCLHAAWLSNSAWKWMLQRVGESELPARRRRPSCRPIRCFRPHSSSEVDTGVTLTLGSGFPHGCLLQLRLKAEASLNLSER